jgi:hypothetical protein
MSAQVGQAACQACGRAFECGIGGSEPCWCSTDFPAVLPLPKDARGCYCRECLARLVAASMESDAT